MAPDNFPRGNTKVGVENNKIADQTPPNSLEIIKRINNKLDNLYDKLRPIYFDNLKPGSADEEISSPLIHELLNTEYKITQLLESIRI